MKPVDPRLLRHARATRVFLVASVALGLAGAALVVVQAMLIAQIVVGSFQRGLALPELRTPLLLLGAVSVGRGLVSWLTELAAHRASAAVKSELRIRLLEHAVRLGPGRLSDLRTGELTALATRGIDALDDYFARYLPQLGLAVVVPAAVLARIVTADWVSAAVIVGTLPLIPLFMVLIGWATQARMDRQWKLLSRLSGHFLDVVAGLPTLKVFGRARAQAESIRAITGEYRRATLRTLRIAFLSSFALELLATLSVALVAVGIGMRLVHGELDLFTGLMVLVLAPEAYLPLRQVGAQYHAAAEGLAAADEVFAVLETQPPAAGSRPAPDARGAALRIDALVVRHPGRTEPSLPATSFTVAPGETVAVVGPSGAGKTTLLNAVLGLVAPSAGRVLLGGTDLAEVAPGSWREQIAWVPQRPYLFAGTVADNVRLARPDADDAAVRDALRAAGALDFVTALPHGVDTALGEDGVGLSAGQRQRIALARAFLADRPMLLLDEPTANLDGQTEAEIVSAISRLAQGRTVLMVLHRPALLPLADHVVELTGHPVAEEAASGRSVAGWRSRRAAPAEWDGLRHDGACQTAGQSATRPVSLAADVLRGADASVMGRCGLGECAAERDVGAREVAAPDGPAVGFNGPACLPRPLAAATARAGITAGLRTGGAVDGGVPPEGAGAPSTERAADALVSRQASRNTDLSSTDAPRERTRPVGAAEQAAGALVPQQSTVPRERTAGVGAVEPATGALVPQQGDAPQERPRAAAEQQCSNRRADGRWPRSQGADVLRRVRRMAQARRARWALALLLGTLALASAVGLMAVSGWLISRAAQQPPILYLMVAVTATRAFGIGRAVFRYAERLVAHDAVFRMLADLRVAVYARLERLAPAALRQARRGDLLSRLVADVDSLQDYFLRWLLPVGAALLVGAGSVAFTAWLLPAAGAVLAAGLLAAGVAVPVLSGALSRRAERQLAPARGALATRVVDLLSGTAELTVAGALAARTDDTRRADGALTSLAARSAAAAGAGSGLSALICGLTVAAAAWTGVQAVHDGRLAGVALAVVVLTPLAAFEAVAGLPSAVRYRQRARRAAERVHEVLDAPEPVREPLRPAPAPASPFPLVVRGLTARHPGRRDAALDGLDLDLTPGRRIAVVGPSGSGKTTLAQVLLRFLDADAGTYTLGGTDAAALGGETVRRMVGLCAQDAHIFDSSLRENLRLARPAADEAELRAVLADARLLDWADSLPLGLDTLVGEHGASLSGGQRQRLALARALLAGFPVLVLDEPAEHLDLPTADALTADLLAATEAAATAGRSTVLITHRLAGLEAVDEVIVLSAGRVVQRGPYQELAAAQGLFRRMLDQERAADACLRSRR